jgi:hypothetical protein
MAHLLSSIIFFKIFISPNFFGSQNLKLSHVDKERQKKMFSGHFSIHKGKKLSKDVIEHYILSKILFFNNSKRYRLWHPIYFPIGRILHLIEFLLNVK